MPVAIHVRLSEKREEILRQREDVVGALGILGLMCCMTWSVLLYLGLAALLGVFDWLGGPGLWLNVVLLCSLVLVSIFAPPMLLPGVVKRYWDKHYAYIEHLLQQTDAGQLILQHERWEPVHELLDAQPWLKLSMLGRPQTLDRQIEFAADHWRALVALTQGNRGLARAVYLGGLTRLSDDLVIIIFNGCGVWLALLLGGAMFLFIPCLLYIPLVHWYIQNQSAQVAVLSFLLESEPPATVLDRD